MRISDWSSDVCSSDLPGHVFKRRDIAAREDQLRPARRKAARQLRADPRRSTRNPPDLILHVVIPNCDLRIKVKRSGIAVKPLVSRISARGWQFCCDSAIINVNAPNFSPLCQRLWASSGVPMEPYPLPL